MSPMAWSRWNSPSVLMSKTRLNSRSSLSDSAWLRSTPPACSSTSIRPLRRRTSATAFATASRIREVDAVIVRRAAGRAHGLNGAERRVRAFERGHLLFHQRGSGALAARLNAGEEVAPEAVLIGDEPAQIGVGGVGLGHDVQQVEGAAGGRRQVGRDGGNDAARRAGDEEAGLAAQRHAGFRRIRPALPARPSSGGRPRIRFPPRRDRAAPPSISRSAISAAAAPAPKSTAFTSASGRSRL